MFSGASSFLSSHEYLSLSDHSLISHTDVSTIRVNNFAPRGNQGVEPRPHVGQTSNF